MNYHFQNPSQDKIYEMIRNAKVIGVVGLSNREDTASYRVASVMKEAGYKIIPINPKLANQLILEEEAYASLVDVREKMDIVCVFRRSDALPEVAREFVKLKNGIFWAQLGLENQEAEEILRQAGFSEIVMNKCLKIEYLNSLSEQM